MAEIVPFPPAPPAIGPMGDTMEMFHLRLVAKEGEAAALKLRWLEFERDWRAFKGFWERMPDATLAEVHSVWSRRRRR
jgi:hypothetical protein